ncbi:protein translocase subunit SecD [Lysinimonas soli]|uniref:Protein translocase subunit SecD n=1 Tax=Lysinimonas soli TaxID=1074233 RepID=A0ABW0NPX2_9MICO
MATRSSPVRKAWRSLAWLLALVVALGALLGAGTLFWGWKMAPQLGLDLQGGTEIILTPQLAAGKSPTPDQLNQAVSIIRQRVDAAGVSEAEISTQGNNNIVVSLPGTPDEATLQRIQASAKLDFRAVICASSESAPSAACTPTAPTATPTPGATAGATPQLSDTPATKPTSGSDEAWVTPKVLNTYSNFKCSSLTTVDTNVVSATKPLVTCDDHNVIYVLGPVEVAGERISDASAGTATTSQGVSTGQWVVNLSFDGTGTTQFGNVSTRLLALSQPRNRFAVVLDGRVITSPTINEAIPNGKAQISGNFTQSSATTLADQLKYGALPIGFKVESRDTIAATLGASQLQNGLIAGGIGLLLVIIYSLFQYRLLGLVTIASLVVAAALTYEVINFMSWQNGYRLSLAGVAGLIVAIGFTADSFIVYFERIRDELRDGRALPGAVEAGWKRALRTIYAAKSVNLLSAIVLFVVAVGNVKGFALTLGITTVIDVLIVILFTHPILQLIAQTRFFSSGHPLSGLDPTALGAIYRGRAEFRISPEARKAGAGREAARRQTIAERKAAELAAAGGTATVVEASAVEAPDARDTLDAGAAASTTSPTTKPATSAARTQPKRSSKSGRAGGKKS